MLRSLQEIIGYKVGAHDGEMGKVMDFFFDDQSWSICYVVVDAGTWLIARPVLISPKKFDCPDWEGQILNADLTVHQIKESPDILTDPPVAHQEKINLERQVWIPPGSPVGHPIYPISKPQPEDTGHVKNDKITSSGNPCLRSVNEVLNYKIHAIDGEIGHVEDFIMETDVWVIHYMIIDTRNWLPGGKKVILSPSWINKVNWSESQVYVNLTCASIKGSPEFNPDTPVNREYESKLFDYYGRPVTLEEK